MLFHGPLPFALVFFQWLHLTILLEIPQNKPRETNNTWEPQKKGKSGVNLSLKLTL
jgi:hypothetical protein